MTTTFAQFSIGIMIENLLNQHQNLGNRRQIVKVLSLLEEIECASIRDLRSVNIPRVVINLLHYLEIVGKKENGVFLAVDAAAENVSLTVCRPLFAKLKEERLLHHFLNERSVYYDPIERRIFVKNNQIPLKFSSLRNLLIDFDVFLFDGLIPSQFCINPNLQEWFGENVAPAIEESRRGDNPLSELLELRARQAAAGKRAEMFVLEYEKRQRKNHKSADNIRIISEIDANAGYDIESYQSDDSLLLDKFIEVKSYVESTSFYWSANEMKSAQERGDSYHLYLVDGDEINRRGYCPLHIKNPVTMLSHNPDWVCRDDGCFYEKKKV